VCLRKSRVDSEQNHESAPRRFAPRGQVVWEPASSAGGGSARLRLQKEKADPSTPLKYASLRACDFFVFSQKWVLKTNDLCAKKSRKFKKVTNSQDDRLMFDMNIGDRKLVTLCRIIRINVYVINR